MNRKKREARILKRAREVAASGKHVGWCYVEAELRVRMGEPLARQVLSDPQIRADLDRICTDARKLRRLARESVSKGPDGAADSLLPSRRRPNAAQKQALTAAGLHVFMRQYGRKAQKRTEPNDRGYDRDIERAVKRTDPATLDRLLRDDEED